MRISASLAISLCLILQAPIEGGAKNKPIVTTGWVSDEACGASHTKPGGEDCVRKCLKGGAAIGHPEWKPQRMVLVTDKDKEVWVVENPEALKGYEGRHVKIKGQINRSKKIVEIKEASIVQEEKKEK
ncbi:MAG: hypothetical protein U0Z53_25405 [Blastocatellia bacterium]